MSSAEIASLIISAVGAVFTSMLTLIVFLLRHGYEAEKRLMMMAIEEAKEEAKRAREKGESEVEKRHAQEVAIGQIEGNILGLRSDVQRLESTDSDQGGQLSDLRSRIDRGARTASQMSPAVSPPSSDPPLGPMRPKAPTNPRGFR